MQAKTIGQYGGPFRDKLAVANPETEQSAAVANRALEDTAQMTRTATRAMVKWNTSAGANGEQTVIDSCSVWGEGSAYAPTVAKTGTGTYTITYDTEYPDALVGTEGNDGVEETEQVSFRFSWGNAIGPTYGQIQCIHVDNVITAFIFNSSGTLSDLGGGIPVQVFAR